MGVLLLAAGLGHVRLTNLMRKAHCIVPNSMACAVLDPCCRAASCRRLRSRRAPDKPHVHSDLSQSDSACSLRACYNVFPVLTPTAVLLLRYVLDRDKPRHFNMLSAVLDPQRRAAPWLQA